MRSDDALIKLKNEIETDPRNLGYRDKTPSEIAAILNTEISKESPEFRVVPISKIQEIITLTEDKVDDIATFLVSSGKVPQEKFNSKQVEILVRRGDELQLGDISQGDIEQALLKDNEEKIDEKSVL